MELQISSQEVINGALAGNYFPVGKFSNPYAKLLV